MRLQLDPQLLSEFRMLRNFHTFLLNLLCSQWRTKDIYTYLVSPYEKLTKDMSREVKEVNSVSFQEMIKAKIYN
jgi:hypothetical protein